MHNNSQNSDYDLADSLSQHSSVDSTSDSLQSVSLGSSNSSNGSRRSHEYDECSGKSSDEELLYSIFNVNQMMEFHWLNGIVLGSVRWVLLLQLVGITRRVLLPPYCIF
jgi:hypothetical protein